MDILLHPSDRKHILFGIAQFHTDDGFLSEVLAVEEKINVWFQYFLNYLIDIDGIMYSCVEESMARVSHFWC